MGGGGVGGSPCQMSGCGGSYQYDSETQNFFCDSCDHQYIYGGGRYPGYGNGGTGGPFKSEEAPAFAGEPSALKFGPLKDKNNPDRTEFSSAKTPVKTSGNACPTCGLEATTTCRCKIGDKSCKNRHHWATCDVHGKVLCNVPFDKKLGYYTHPIPRCSCHGQSNFRR